MATTDDRLSMAADILHMPEEELRKNLNKENLDHLLMMNEVTKLTQVSPDTIRRQVKAGNLTAVKIGRALRFKRKDIAAFISACSGGENASSS